MPVYFIVEGLQTKWESGVGNKSGKPVVNTVPKPQCSDESGLGCTL